MSEITGFREHRPANVFRDKIGVMLAGQDLERSSEDQQHFVLIPGRSVELLVPQGEISTTLVFKPDMDQTVKSRPELKGYEDLIMFTSGKGQKKYNFSEADGGEIEAEYLFTLTPGSNTLLTTMGGEIYTVS